MKEYRMESMFYDGYTHYHIERRIDGGEWKLLFGGLTRNMAKEYLEDPDAIEKANKHYNRTGYALLIFVGVLIIGCTIYYNV